MVSCSESESPIPPETPETPEMPSVVEQGGQSFGINNKEITSKNSINLVAKEFIPHGDQLSWEEVYAGWQSTDIQYYWKKHDLNIVPLDRDYMANRDAKSFELARTGDETVRPALIRIANQEADPEKRKAAEEALRELDKLAGKPS